MKGRNGKVEYRREFFDRDYTVREAYARVWKYAKKYKLRLAIGVVCGMATAGTLVPFFQIVQPALQHVESHDNEVEVGSRTVTAVAADPMPVEEVAGAAASAAGTAKKPKNAFEKEIAKNSKLPGWYPKVEKWAAKIGIRLQDEKGGMGGALVLIVCFIVPVVALLRLGLM